MSSSPDDLAFGYAPRRAKPFSWNRGQYAWGWCDERHRPPDPEIEALHRIGVNRAAKILAAQAERSRARRSSGWQQQTPFTVADQTGAKLGLFLDHAFDFIRYTVSGLTSETSKPAW